MSPDQDQLERLIWATRGRSWGFRFLLDGGLSDPLQDYERTFAGIGDDPTAFRRGAGKTALRFPDPLSRRDASGRVIPHEFVVFGNLADEIGSVEDGLQRIWPIVAGAFAAVWDAEGPPSAADLRVAAQENPPRASPRSADDASGYEGRAEPRELGEL